MNAAAAAADEIGPDDAAEAEKTISCVSMTVFRKIKAIFPKFRHHGVKCISRNYCQISSWESPEEDGGT